MSNEEINTVYDSLKSVFETLEKKEFSPMIVNNKKEIEALEKENPDKKFKAKEDVIPLKIKQYENFEKEEFETRNNKYNNEIEKLKKEIKELEKKDINATLKQIKKLELGEFINENFEKLSKLLIDKIVVKKSDDKTRVILNIYINLFNITYIWDYNNFEKISSLCSHNENNDCSSCY